MESNIAQFSTLAVYGTIAAYTVATIAFATDLSGLMGKVVSDRRRAAGIAMAATVAGFALHVLGTVTRGFAAGRVPWANMYEFSLVFSVVMVGAYLVLNRRYDLRYLGVAVVGLASVTLWVAVGVFYVAADAVQPALRTFWLVIHVSLASLAVGVVAMSAIASVVQLLQERGETRRAAREDERELAGVAAGDAGAGAAESAGGAGTGAGRPSGAAGGVGGTAAATAGVDGTGRSDAEVPEHGGDKLDEKLGFFGRLGRRLPTSAALEIVAFRLNAVGFVLWTLTLITGAVWAEYAWGRPWGWDPKEVWTLLIWIIYAAYLHARLTRGWQGRRAAYLSIFAFVLVMGNYYLVNLFFNSQHAYSGIG